MAEKRIEKTNNSAIKKKSFPKTYAVTAAQGIQTPYSANAYGHDPQAGRPNKLLIKNIEDYVKINEAELQICGIAGAYVNAIELDEFFHDRDDVYLHSKAIKRNEQNKVKEQDKRDKWEAAGMKGDMPMHYFWMNIPETDYQVTGKNLNSNLRIVGTQTPPQNKDPIQGKQSLLKKFNGRSLLMPATKQRLKPFASGQAGEYPKLMFTTGACTHPSYNDTNMRGEEAEDMHKYGFAVADVLSDKIYLPRIVPAQKNGTFIDLGIKYSRGKAPEKAETTAMVIGDSHVAQIHPKVDRANREMMDWFQPKYTHLNDTFDALSINLHALNDSILQDELHAKGLDNLEKEVLLTAQYLYENGHLAKKFGGEILVNFSNHDDMIYRWLTDQKFMSDKENRKFAYQLMAQPINRDNTFETIIKYVMPEMPENVRFLKRGEDRIYWGYQCAAHGHLGKNGARGNLKNLKEGYTKVIKGHAHEFEIDDESIGVGTSAIIPMPYQLGQPSTSMAANGVVYNGGLSQGIPIIKGKWAKDGFNDFLKK